MSKIERWDEKIWNFFASVDLAVALFIIISIGAAIGTIIPQQSDPDVVVRFFSKFLSISGAARVYDIVNLLDLNNVYHSWWFTFLLFMFALNLVVCSVDRLPRLLKSYKSPFQPLSLQVLEKMPLKKELKIEGDIKIGEIVIDVLRKKGFSTDIAKIENGITQIGARKWQKSKLAIYLTHFSILIILAGALIGTFFGFRGNMNIVEGSGLDFAISDEGKAIPLNFRVVCDKFEIEYYENTAIPKAFRSYLRIIENGQSVKFNGKEEVVLEVNQPFSYKGITFYQASYGFQPSEHAEFRFTYFDRKGREIPIKARFEEKFKIPDSLVTASVIDFSPALGVDEQGRLFNMSTDMINPAVLLSFEEGQKRTQKWILKKIPETWETPYGKLKFNELWGAQFTGLQVRKDPGVPLIYIGSIMLCIGLFISLFLRPLNYFINIDRKTITFYSPSMKNRVIVERQINDIINLLKGVKK